LYNNLRFFEAKEEYQKAIALDSTFGLAYYRLGYSILWSSGTPEITITELFLKANEFIDHIPEKERYLVRATIAHLTQGLQERITILEEMEKYYPNDKQMLFDMGEWIPDHNKAVEYLKKVNDYANNSAILTGSEPIHA